MRWCCELVEGAGGAVASVTVAEARFIVVMEGTWWLMEVK